MGSEEEEPKPWRWFWLGVALGAVRSLCERERERNKITTINRNERIRMHEICMNMWRAKFKLHHGWNPIETYQHTFNNNQTNIYNAWNIVRMQWECYAWAYRNNFTKPNPKISGKTQGVFGRVVWVMLFVVFEIRVGEKVCGNVCNVV